MAQLALRGGPKTRKRPFAVWPVYSRYELQGLRTVLRSRHWGTLGPQVRAFERDFARYLGAAHCVTATNGTAALELILRALDVGPGDEVIVPPYTFIATASAALMVGATPVFADVDIRTNTLDPRAVERAITPRTRAIVPVHIAGIPADMDDLLELAREHAIPLVEDAAQAHGSQWRGKMLGTLGTAGAFSFQLSKNMSAGEGGAVVTNDEALAKRVWSIHHVGRRPDGLWYGHYELAGNFRMTDWQAAILRAQLLRLDRQIAARERSAELLNTELAQMDGIEVFPRDPRATRITHHLYMFRYLAEAFGGAPRDRFVAALTAEGIPASTGYVDIRTQPLFTHPSVTRVAPELDATAAELPVAEQACRETVWIPQNVLLGPRRDAVDVIRAIVKIRNHADELLDQ